MNDFSELNCFFISNPLCPPLYPDKDPNSGIDYVVDKVAKLTIQGHGELGKASPTFKLNIGFYDLVHPDLGPKILGLLSKKDRRNIFSNPITCHQAHSRWLRQCEGLEAPPKHFLENFIRYCENPKAICRVLEDCAERVKNWTFTEDDISFIPAPAAIALVSALRHMPLWKAAVAFYSLETQWVSEPQHHRISRLAGLMNRVNEGRIDLKLTAMLQALPYWRYYGHRLVIGPLKSVKDGIERLPDLQGITVKEISKEIVRAFDMVPKKYRSDLLDQAPKLTLALLEKYVSKVSEHASGPPHPQLEISGQR